LAVRNQSKHPEMSQIGGQTSEQSDHLMKVAENSLHYGESTDATFIPNLEFNIWNYSEVQRFSSSVPCTVHFRLTLFAALTYHQITLVLMVVSPSP
jgi:hypothetical protein